MNKKEINKLLFDDLYKSQIEQIELSDLRKEVKEAHSIITKLLFAWERLEFDEKVTDQSTDWLGRNSKL